MEARFSFTSDVSGLRLDKFLIGEMEGFSRCPYTTVDRRW